ncbi:MAG: hypothetical protein AABZ13_02585 [Planctomycetota bacterium]
MAKIEYLSLTQRLRSGLRLLYPYGVVLALPIKQYGYELNNRLEWILIPLEGIKYLMEEK